MKNTIFLLIIINAFFFTSCKKDNIVHTEKVIDLTDAYYKKMSKVNLSEIASSIEYIPLQSDSTSILGNFDYRNIKFFDKNILIKDDNDNLLLFNDSGKFEAKIGVAGRGPGEFTKITDFTLLPKDSLIIVNSRLDKKLFFYNYKGNFIKERNTPFQTEGLFSFNGDLISINSFPFRKYSSFHTLNVFTNDGVLKKQLLHKSNEEKLLKTNGGRVYWGYKSDLRNTYVLDDKQFMWEVSLYNSKDTIWEISTDFIVKPKHILYFGGEKPQIDAYYKERPEKNTLYTSVQGFVETDKYMFMEVVIAKLNRVQFIWRKKETNSNIQIGYDNPLKPGYNFSFYNDIDGGIPFWPEGMIKGNKVYKLIYGYELKDYLQNISSKELDTKTAKNKVELVKMVKNSKITDNPILMIVNLK